MSKLDEDFKKLEKLYMLHGAGVGIKQSDYKDYTISLESWERIGYVFLKYQHN